ncbi:HalOD1 output domain-containing protein [Halobaculum marinum]|uniref:HalOD1 output domain-containing protein n=1 Tax=Halobaculum marinum TaxID=3031996 RepID=A0ABD5WZH3_9EURY|nr:HalOD1 output domain-containing protein [Halobaculum sp. DT55]
MPSFTDRLPDAVDPRSPWLTPTEQLLLVFERLGVDPASQSPVLQDSIDADALNCLVESSSAVVSFELWGYWVRITPSVVELYGVGA